MPNDICLKLISLVFIGAYVHFEWIQMIAQDMKYCVGGLGFFCGFFMS